MAGERATAPSTLKAAAWDRARRPKPSKLALNSTLRALVEEKLELRWSPQQISQWLRRTYGDDEAMQVSHETIYLSLFVQSRGALRRELSGTSAQWPAHAASTRPALESPGTGADPRQDHDLRAPG